MTASSSARVWTRKTSSAPLSSDQGPAASRRPSATSAASRSRWAGRSSSRDGSSEKASRTAYMHLIVGVTGAGYGGRMSEEQVPTLFGWAGGAPAFRRLIDAFYDRVERDDLLSLFFPGGVHEDHRSEQHVSVWEKPD